MSDIKKQEAMEMAKAGMSVPVIAHEMDVSPQTIRNWLKAQGQEQPTATKDVLAKEAEVIEAYEAGVAVATILKQFDIERAKLYYLLSKYSVTTRQTTLKDSRKRALDEACQMYKDGFVIRQITEDTGVHQPTLHAELARRGIELRRPRGFTPTAE
jgi:transposase-like protein